MDLKAGLETLPSVAFEGSWVYEYDYIGRRVRKYRRTLQFENMMMSQEAPEGQMEGPQTQSNFGEGGEQGLITDETKFFYDGWLLTLEVSGYAAIRSFYYGLDLSGSTSGAAGIGGLLFQLNGAATPGPTNTRWFCHDPQGNVTSLRSVSDNTRIASLETGPYGDQTIADGQVDELKLRFSGKYWDQETGQSDFGFRHYCPDRGRWMNRDPISEQGGRNIYAMSYNNPVSVTDSVGLTPELWVFSGINNDGNSYMRTELEGLGIETNRDWRSDVKIDNWDNLDLSPRKTLDNEADDRSKQFIGDGAFANKGCIKSKPWRIHVIMLSPKTHARPRRGGCLVTIDVLYSPFDLVPNQAPGEEDGPAFWQQFGTTYIVDTRVSPSVNGRSDSMLYPRSFPNHGYQAFLSPLPEIRRNNVTIPFDDNLTIEQNRRRREDSEWVTTGRTIDSVQMIRDMMQRSDIDYVWVCHSQGCNMAMYSLNRACN